MYIILAMLAGASTVISSVLNSKIAQNVGTFKSAFINYCTGFIPSVIYCVFILATDSIKFEGEIPFYLFLGGFVGVFVVFSSNLVFAKISAVMVTLLVFIGQICLGTLIDIFVFQQNISLLKIVGIIVISIGIYINLVIDKKESV